MRLLCVLVVASCAAQRQAPMRASTPAKETPHAAKENAARGEPRSNSTPLDIEELATPDSAMSVRIASPAPGESVTEEAARAFPVRLSIDSVETDALGVDLALDGERPRRVPVAKPDVALGDLLPVDAPLRVGAHWLFAAPIGGSGLVPRAVDNKPRSALARRFFVGSQAGIPGAADGALWLRKPEGTYNGKAAQHVLFDAFLFDAEGAPLATPSTIAISARGSTGSPGSPRVSGELRWPAPFAARELASGDYDVRVSAPNVEPRAVRITVNHELGGAP